MENQQFDVWKALVRLPGIVMEASNSIKREQVKKEIDGASSQMNAGMDEEDQGSDVLRKHLVDSLKPKGEKKNRIVKTALVIFVKLPQIVLTYRPQL